MATTITDRDQLVPLSRLHEVFDVEPVPSRETVGKWIKSGCPVNGTRVKLRAKRRGRLWLISRRYVEEFDAACAAASAAEHSGDAPRSRSQPRRRLNMKV